MLKYPILQFEFNFFCSFCRMYIAKVEICDPNGVQNRTVMLTCHKEFLYLWEVMKEMDHLLSRDYPSKMGYRYQKIKFRLGDKMIAEHPIGNQVNVYTMIFGILKRLLELSKLSLIEKV